jgi:hypothetical protein
MRVSTLNLFSLFAPGFLASSSSFFDRFQKMASSPLTIQGDLWPVPLTAETDRTPRYQPTTAQRAKLDAATAAQKAAAHAAAERRRKRTDEIASLEEELAQRRKADREAETKAHAEAAVERVERARTFEAEIVTNNDGSDRASKQTSSSSAASTKNKAQSKSKTAPPTESQSTNVMAAPLDETDAAADRMASKPTLLELVRPESARPHRKAAAAASSSASTALPSKSVGDVLSDIDSVFDSALDAALVPAPMPAAPSPSSPPRRPRGSSRKL